VSIDLLLSRLDGLEATSRGWRARCPAHQDRRPSLSVAVGAGDRVLLHDFAGCRADEVLSAVGLTWRDLHHGGRAHRDHPRPAPPGDPIKVALAAALARERRRRQRLAITHEFYRDADLVRALYAYAREAHRLADELGPDHPDVWSLVAIAATAQTDAAVLETLLDNIDLRRPAA
jgi:hypothetical protein